MIVLNHAPHGHALAQAMKSVFNPLSETVIARVERGKLLGGLIYEGFTGTSVCMHVCGLSPNWLNRRLIWMAFAYPFGQLSCNLLLARIASTNLKSLALAAHFGFIEAARIEGAVPDGDLVLLTMQRAACRWFKPKAQGVMHNGEAERTRIAGH